MKILIVDDEAPARARLAELVRAIGGHEIVGEAANGKEVLEQWNQLEPDIVLLDIRMPVVDGLETAQHLSSLDNPPAIIFTTAYDEFALEAFEVRAIAYLMKPVRQERLEAALENASTPNRAQMMGLRADAGRKSREHICARIRERIQVIPVQNILCFQADQKYVTVYHTEGETLIDEPLKSLEEEFGNQFIRIHRNALVASQYVVALEKYGENRFQVRLRGLDTLFEVSRRLVPDVRRRLKAG